MIRAEPVPFEPPRPPAWARLSGSFRDHSEAEALFFAGAALSALDSVAKSGPSWAGVWRRRLALKCAAAVVHSLLNRREDEAGRRVYEDRYRARVLTNLRRRAKCGAFGIKGLVRRANLSVGYRRERTEARRRRRTFSA